MKKKSLFKFFFKEFYNELEDKKKKLKVANENCNETIIKLKEKVKKLKKENLALKDALNDLKRNNIK